MLENKRRGELKNEFRESSERNDCERESDGTYLSSY